MKLNLAALPKEEAWALFLSVFRLTMASDQIADDEMAAGREPSDAALEAVMQLAAVLTTVDVADDRPDSFRRGLFERWWAEQVQG